MELFSEQWRPNDNLKYCFPLSIFFLNYWIFSGSSAVFAKVLSIVLKLCNLSALKLSKPVIGFCVPGFNDFSICHNVLFDNDLRLNEQ